jgi:hypothetical protein
VLTGATAACGGQLFYSDVSVGQRVPTVLLLLLLLLLCVCRLPALCSTVT